MVRQREMQLQEEMDGLSQEWNKERRVSVCHRELGHICSEGQVVFVLCVFSVFWNDICLCGTV